jgi:hypothetical protein
LCLVSAWSWGHSHHVMIPIPICTTRPTAQPSTLKLHGSARIARHTYSPKSSSVAFCQLSVRNLMSCPSSRAARRANSSFELAVSDPASGSTCLAPAAFSASSLRRRICLPCGQLAGSLKYAPFWMVGTVARAEPIRRRRFAALCTLAISGVLIAASQHARTRHADHTRGGATPVGEGSVAGSLEWWWSKNTSDIMRVVPGAGHSRRAVIRRPRGSRLHPAACPPERTPTPDAVGRRCAALAQGAR